jgi:hypothetical protein
VAEAAASSLRRDGDHLTYGSSGNLAIIQNIIIIVQTFGQRAQGVYTAALLLV